MPNTTLEPLDVLFAETGQCDTALREPAIEGERVSYFDVDDACSVLLLNQRCDESAKMTRQGAGGTAGERSRALIRSLHALLLAGGSAQQGGSLCPAR